MDAYGWAATITSGVCVAAWGVTGVARKIVDAKEPVIEAIRAVRAVRDELRGSNDQREISQHSPSGE
jgi:hypothetical protein